MRFFRTELDQNYSDRRNVCFLINDNWDDFTFKTSFHSVVFDQNGKRHDIGGLRILSRGLKAGRVNPPSHFEQLDSRWCSLGADRDYYLNLSKLGEPTVSVYLKAIRDCVFDRTIFEAFKNEEGMQTSLLRTVSRRDILDSLAGKLIYHFRELRLEKRFRRQAAAVLVELEAEVTQLAHELEPEQIVAHLLNRAGQFGARNLNSLETAAYYAAAASDVYCNGSFHN